MSSLIIYSGGLDSTVMLHKFKKDIKLAISFDYGSNHNYQELQKAILNCKELNIEHIVLNLENVFKYFNSGLLKGKDEIPEGHYESKNMKQTVVPFRNGIMLSIAAGLAESKKFDTIMLGNHSGDHAIYPDCREEFIQSMARAINLGIYEPIRLFSPFCHMDKRKIAKIGQKLNLDFKKTYTCYKGEELHCGVCGSCVERKEALEGFDPTSYKEVL